MFRSQTESRSESLHGRTGLRCSRGTFFDETGWKKGSRVELQSFHDWQATGSTVKSLHPPASQTQVSPEVGIGPLSPRIGSRAELQVFVATSSAQPSRFVQGAAATASISVSQSIGPL